jgi:uncharacterized protein (DUF1697 family)
VALVAFIRGINVGGHRRLRPAVLAQELSTYGVINVGAAGTFVVCRPGSRSRFRSELLRRLPSESQLMICDGREVLGLESDNPFGMVPSRPDIVRFVSILSKTSRVQPSLPIALPTVGKWLVRVLGSRGRFVFGVYRRHMKTIGYLGKIDRLFAVPATTRNWNTMMTIAQILRGLSKRES